MAKLDESEQQIVRRGQLELDDLTEVLREQFGIPRHARVRFWTEVPAGGDYSGQSLDIEDEGPQAISFKAEWTE